MNRLSRERAVLPPNTLIFKDKASARAYPAKRHGLLPYASGRKGHTAIALIRGCMIRCAGCNGRWFGLEPVAV